MTFLLEHAAELGLKKRIKVARRMGTRIFIIIQRLNLEEEQEEEEEREAAELGSAMPPHTSNWYISPWREDEAGKEGGRSDTHAN